MIILSFWKSILIIFYHIEILIVYLPLKDWIFFLQSLSIPNLKEDSRKSSQQNAHQNCHNDVNQSYISIFRKSVKFSNQVANEGKNSISPIIKFEKVVMDVDRRVIRFPKTNQDKVGSTKSHDHLETVIEWRYQYL